MPNDIPQRDKDDAEEAEFFETQRRAGTISADTADRLNDIGPVKATVPTTYVKNPVPVSMGDKNEESELLGTARYVDN